MSESRADLLAWVNELCKVNYTKVEQCGSGAVHCAIMDSIYRDVPMSRVKFMAKHEYEFVANFKILQAVFDKHKIDNAIPVERLIKCKFQDNLEFLQWVKKYWDQYFQGAEYNALSRRSSSSKKSTATPIKVKAEKDSFVPRVAPAAESSGKISTLMNELSDLKLNYGQIEKERDFYFEKLRDIELFVQTQVSDENLKPSVDTLKKIQEIMYKTDDGFEIPNEEL